MIVKYGKVRRTYLVSPASRTMLSNSNLAFTNFGRPGTAEPAILTPFTANSSQLSSGSGLFAGSDEASELRAPAEDVDWPISYSSRQLKGHAKRLGSGSLENDEGSLWRGIQENQADRHTIPPI